jgi:5,10-methylene-tetrahydrofolate dehydrogenase/methenyl tetrahydrofolate cyclohydrolase
MTAKLLKGSEIANGLIDKLKSQRDEAAKRLGHAPVLGLVQIGAFKDAELYAQSIGRVMTKLGVDTQPVKIAESCTLESAQQQIRALASNKKITGVLLLSPVPPQLPYASLIQALPANKDVEAARGIGQKGKGNIFPPTALALMELILATGEPLEGKEAVVVGRSEIVGQPIAKLLLNHHATVTICHSRTKNLNQHVGRAEIVVAAVGKAGLIKGDWIKPGAIVADAGENFVNGKVTGDVEFESASQRASFITPVPSGVGPLTTYMLAKNLFVLASSS